jgi:AGZA family xanthine/uracil permease-like MFS transporter
LTFSIADGLALGFVTYTIAKVVSGRYSEVNAAVWVLTVILLAKLIFLGG